MQNKGALKDKGKGKSERSVKPKDSNSAGKWDLLSARQNGDNEEEHVSYAHSSEGQARKALVDNKSKPSGKGAKREKSRGPSKYKVQKDGKDKQGGGGQDGTVITKPPDAAGASECNPIDQLPKEIRRKVCRPRWCAEFLQKFVHEQMLPFPAS